MIDNRPEYLNRLKYYQKIPTEFKIDLNKFPSLLSTDIDFLNKSCQPLTNRIDKFYEDNYNYNKMLTEFYNSKSVKFQMINIVASIYDFKKVNGIQTAIPYALSITSVMKRGNPQFVVPELALIYSKSDLLENKMNYTHFDPFNGSYGLFTSKFSGLVGDDSFTDELGLIIGTYFLSSEYDDSEVILPGPYEQDLFTQRKFLKHREKKYFNPILNDKPRKIWGSDSPIELFMLQGLSEYGYYPEIQTIIFDDGAIYPNYYEMVEDNNWVKGRITRTEVDLFFKNERIAVFCDSSFHRGKKKKQSAKNIDKFLNTLDIKVIRIESKDIMNSTSKCIDLILNELKK